jgi:competence protein ComEC
LKEFLLPTLAATIFTFPLISYSFGYFSLLSILANILIIWLIPLLMFSSFVSIMVATIFYPLGQVLAWVTNIGLSYVIITGEKLGGTAFSSVNIRIPLVVCLMCYAGLFWIISKKKLKNIEY